MNMKVIKALYKKEILDILRDKKTIFMMILIPIVLYPLLMLGSVAIAGRISNDAMVDVYQVAFYDVSNDTALRNLALEREEISNPFVFCNVKNPKESLLKKEIDAYLTQGLNEQGKTVYQIHYLSSHNQSSSAANALKDLLKAYQVMLQKEQLKEANIDVDIFYEPVVIEEVNEASKEATMGSIFGLVMGFLLITSVLLGAIYPAIDVTAGEKERGTLETLFTLPVSNQQLITSKFLAVSTISVVSALLNIISLVFVCSYMINSMELMGFGENITIQVTQFIPVLLLSVLCLIVFAMFVSAVCLSVCIFAKSFKEAQNYSTPILLIFMIMSYIGIIPGVALDAKTAFIPVANVSLLIKGLFAFDFSMRLVVLVLFTNVIYSVLAILLMAYMYRSEEILFGESMKGLHIIAKRSEMKPKQIPSISDMALLLSVLLLALIYGGTFAMRRFGVYGVIIQQLMILILPIAYAWFMKCDRSIFRLKKPRISLSISAIFMWFGTFCIMLVVASVLSTIFKESANQLVGLEDMLTSQSIWFLIVAVGILPAIGEEFLFRGFLFGGLERKQRAGVAIVIVSALFGIYHMSLIKFFTTGILGIVLAYVTYFGGSIFYSVLIHFCNNLFSILIMKGALPFLQQMPIFAKDSLDFMEGCVVLFVGVGFLGVGCIGFVKKLAFSQKT